MKTTTSFRVRVMSYAHHIFVTTVISWSDALKKAWQLYRLAKLMRQGVVKFYFEKVDGSARVAYGTMCYWDTKKNAFRSFRVENFIAIAV